MKKKRVASKSALNEMALTKGATITSESGARFNAAKDKPSGRMPAKAKSKPQAKTETKAAPSDTMAIVEQMKESNASLVAALADLKGQISAIQMNAKEPITDWEFDIIRDERTGSTTKIKACAPKINRKLS